MAAQSDRKGQLRRISGRRKNSSKRGLKAIGWMWIGFAWLRINRAFFVLRAVINYV